MPKYIFSKGVVSIDPSMYAAVENPATEETGFGLLILASHNHPPEAECTSDTSKDDKENNPDLSNNTDIHTK